jgi:hypothetical protein
MNVDIRSRELAHHVQVITSQTFWRMIRLIHFSSSPVMSGSSNRAWQQQSYL